MNEQIAATETVAPEAVEEAPKVEAQEVETEGEEASDDEAKKSAAKERRERDKAYKARLREEREAALQKAAAAESRMARIKAAGEASAEPKESDFADYTEFVAAKAVWRHAKGQIDREAGDYSEQAEQARKTAEQLAAQERQLAFEAYDAHRQDARTRYADFDAVVAQPGLFPAGSHLPDLILQSDSPADVAYEIAKDRNLHDALLRAHPVEVARIIGRIEAKISLPKPNLQTQAPDPVSPVKPKPSGMKSPEKMSYEEYRAARMSGKLK
jgi:hypothetical protein